MRVLTMTAALALSGVELIVASLVLFSPGESRAIGAVVLAAACLTFGGALAGVISVRPVGPILVAGSQLVVSGLLTDALWREWLSTRAFGLDLAVGMTGAALLACAAVAGGAIVAWGPSRGRRIGLAVSGTLVLAGGVATATGTAAELSRFGCERFAFERSNWAAGIDAQMRMTRAIVRCGTLDGRTRGEVEAMLGGDQRSFGTLDITYDADGRVRAVRDRNYD